MVLMHEPVRLETAGKRATLPPDCVMLPLRRGRLLVSPDHAVFCPVPEEDVSRAEAVLRGEMRAEVLGPALLAELERHGFFGPPRPAEEVSHSVQLQLTNACNLACAYCCTNSGTPRERELTLDRCLEVVRQVRPVLGEGTRVAILGGEPLLVPWALDLAAAVLDEGLGLTLFTNGMLLGRDPVARRVAGLQARGMEVRVSLAGVTAADCDGLSGAPRFEEVLARLHALVGHGGAAIVDLMLLPEHVDAVASRFHLLRRRLPPETRVSLGLLYLSGRERGEHQFAERSRLEEALDRIALEAGETIAATARGPLALRREGCGCALGHHLHLRSDGTLFTCFKMEERVGHLDEESFALAARRVRESPHPAASLAACAGCPLRTLCGGGCRSDNLLHTGDPDRPLCAPWRVQVLCELLAEEHITAPEWPLSHLLHEAHRRGIEAPAEIQPARQSRHLLDL